MMVSEALVMIGAGIGSFAGLLAALAVIMRWGKGLTRKIAQRGAEAINIDALDPRSDVAKVATMVAEIRVLLEKSRTEDVTVREAIRVILRDRLYYLSSKALEGRHISLEMKATLDEMYRIARELGCNGELVAIYDLVDSTVVVDRPFPGIPKGETK